ncbi:MAG: hypothetical protein E7774_13050 [Bradyrhizobium sp.]|nr:MAG: hypothetical protein E7774_13050 [Bradyrhizobium sp.]
MKRPPHSFVVEVRRQRRPPGEAAKSWFEEPAPAAATPAALAAFAEPAAAPVEAPAPSRPAGRILPSLVEPAPAEPSPVLATPPAAKRRGRPAATGSKTPRAKTPAGRASKAPRAAEPIGVAMRASHPAPTEIAAKSAAALPAPESGRSARAERHARILERYVFIGEPKPGERWKRRLQRGDR